MVWSDGWLAPLFPTGGPGLTGSTAGIERNGTHAKRHANDTRTHNFEFQRTTQRGDEAQNKQATRQHKK